MVKIARFLIDHPEVVKVNLCYNNIGNKGLKDFARMYLHYENNLQHLNLMGCDLTGKGMKYFCKCADTLKLKTLRVNGNKLGREVTSSKRLKSVTIWNFLRVLSI